MHLAVPGEFDSVITGPDNSVCFDEMTEVEIRTLWAESYEKLDNRDLNF